MYRILSFFIVISNKFFEEQLFSIIRQVNTNNSKERSPQQLDLHRIN